MAPRIDGEVHMFAEHGLYNGLFLMKDEESGTFWDHLTGQAVYGPLVGETLEVSTLRQTTVGQLLDTDGDAMIALSSRNLRTDDQMTADGLLAGIRGRLNGMFSRTVKSEDTRRPTMDMGIGLWQGDEAMYYPLDVVRADGRALIDTFGGEQVLIYIDPKAFVLAALYVDAESAEWDGDVIRLSDGAYVEGGLLYDSAGQRVKMQRPLQVFTRWYGFALTYPDTDIYVGGR